MLFDLSGKRKHVVRVVYAILALLMGGSLFLVIGPFNLADLASTGSSISTSAALDERAEKIERQLRKDPTDEVLLLALARTRINVGTTLSVNPETGEREVSPEARAELEQGQQAWSRYVKHTSEAPNPVMAQLVAETYFSLAESSNSIPEVEEAIENAAATQQLAVESKRDANSLSTLAIYLYFDGNFSEGDKIAKAATKLTSSSEEAKKQLEGYRKNAKEWQKQKQEFAKAERGTGKESLQNPYGGLAGSSAESGITQSP
jgi:hypothetical protein